MLSNERQDKILAILKKKYSATVQELSKELYASSATVRRDLEEMQNMGLLKRSHGGAVLIESADEISIFVRMTENARQKELAATRALKYIPMDFQTVFLDSSSTVLALAQRMNLTDKTVITNNLQTVLQLSKIKGINLIIPGGSISTTGVSVTGSWTMKQLSEFRYDLMLTSCAALTATSAFETSLDQRDIKRTVFERSACRILIADRTKFHAHGTYCFQDLSAFDKLVFDTLSEEEKAALEGLPVIC